MSADTTPQLGQASEANDVHQAHVANQLSNAHYANPELAEDEISLLDLLAVLSRYLPQLIFVPILIGSIALGIAFLITPTFTAKAQVLPPQQQQNAASALLGSIGALSGLASSAGLKNPGDPYVPLYTSRTIADVLLQRFNLQQRYEEEYKVKARKRLADSSKISAGKDGLISIEFSDRDPEFAAKVANAYTEELQKLLSKLAVTEAQQRRVFFEKHLTATKDRMVAAEKALRATGINPSILKSSPEVAVADLAKLKAAITAQEIKIAGMRGYYADSSDDMKRALNGLSILRGQLSKLEQNQPVVTSSNPDYIERYREFKYQETLYELFAKQFELAKVDESRDNSVIQVLDPAIAPELKSKPKRALIALIAAVATLFLMILWIFIKEALNNAKNDPESAETIATIKRNVRFWSRR